MVGQQRVYSFPRRVFRLFWIKCKITPPKKKEALAFHHFINPDTILFQFYSVNFPANTTLKSKFFPHGYSNKKLRAKKKGLVRDCTPVHS